MAVFTPVSEDALIPWLKQRHAGELVNLKGIASGIENTNYFVDTSTGRHVLTIFEKLTAVELPYYLGLMQHLSAAGLPVPKPALTDDGALFSPLMGKPAALVDRLPGESAMKPNEAQCHAIGEFSAQAHQAARSFGMRHDNPRGLPWWLATQAQLREFIPADLRALLDDEIGIQQDFARSPVYPSLERVAVHADLFRDNALFTGDRLGGVIDFYFAGDDTRLFDLAVCINDWCINHQTGHIEPALARALLDGYAAHQPFSETDRKAWPYLLRAAALRFWMSRLYDFYIPREAEMLTPKDPTHFERILKLRRAGDIAALPS
jgi:homoserine kinase type II